MRRNEKSQLPFSPKGRYTACSWKVLTHSPSLTNKGTSMEVSFKKKKIGPWRSKLWIKINTPKHFFEIPRDYIYVELHPKLFTQSSELHDYSAKAYNIYHEDGPIYIFSSLFSADSAIFRSNSSTTQLFVFVRRSKKHQLPFSPEGRSIRLWRLRLRALLCRQQSHPRDIPREILRAQHFLL